VKSDKLEIGRILHLKLEIKKSQIGQSEGRDPEFVFPLGSSNLRFFDF